MSYPYIIQGSNCTVVIGNTPHTISKTHVTYQKVLDAIKCEDWDTVKDIIEPRKVVINYGNGNVSIKGETLYWRGQEFHNAMSTRMIQMLQDGFSVEPMVLFMENMMQNPSYRSVQELYGFMEANNLPLTPDGCFLAYKRVKDNYTDCHTGKMDNSIGQVVTMERNQVDDNQNNTCSRGLHFCSHSYLQNFGGQRTVILKINPKDVVSIPTDYNNSKGRTCRYEVVGEVEVNPEDAVEFNQPVQTNANSTMPKSGPKVGDPKVGSNDFYRGYTAGYNSDEYDWDAGDSSDAYSEGYDKGASHAELGIAERYSYVDPNKKDNINQAAWPFPVYDNRP